ncbi:MAG TPA: enoyl-CoA hydratase/isomerase family protein [Baekduia sp.]|nr:enoyl-CoA hydratase/isomerase family protein [Baekduia sp.]
MAALTRERLDDGIEVLRLDRPEVRNAMDTAMLEELLDALAELAADEGLRVLVISTTSERALSAGADVAEELDHAAGVARMERFARLYAAIEAFPAPTIAVCVGNVVGAGAELAAGCDLRVVGDNLKLLFPGAKLGVPVGPARLVPLVGLSKARELIFTGRVVDADEAEALGLVARRAPADRAEAEAIELARALAAHPADGLRHLKELFRRYESTEERVAQENAEIVAFQRGGAGLPYGGVKR